MRGCKIALGAGIAAGLLLVAPASGQAAQLFGSNLNSAPTTNVPCSDPCSLWNTSLPPAQTSNSVFSPITGVVTKFTLKKQAGNWPLIHLRVVIPLAGNGGVPWRGGARTAPPDVLPTNTAGTQSFVTHLPVTAGDLVALSGNGGDLHNIANTPGSAGRGAVPDLPADGSQGNTVSISGAEILVQYSVEPDADADGFGDESEDKCAGQNGPNDGCPAPKAKKCKKKKKKGKSAASAKEKCKKKKKKKG